jgi:hypothetical protein
MEAREPGAPSIEGRVDLAMEPSPSRVSWRGWWGPKTVAPLAWAQNGADAGSDEAPGTTGATSGAKSETSSDGASVPGERVLQPPDTNELEATRDGPPRTKDRFQPTT